MREVVGVPVEVLELQDVRLTDTQTLLLLEGMSSFAAIGVVHYDAKVYLPILAEGFCPYRVPVVFSRILVGVPPEEPIPLEEVVRSFTTT